ncbi:helix-turn-helix transcriptional regulator [Paracoccus pacificus]|uniref:Helix-turn-helix transcriptional regulator n=1 Tax=Paracoccus pacificus TaxID=1463598 RepID=A0ABW4RC60_9RHOB
MNVIANLELVEGRYIHSPDLHAKAGGKVAVALLVDAELQVLASGPDADFGTTGVKVWMNRLSTGNRFWDARIRHAIRIGAMAELGPGSDDGGYKIFVFPMRSTAGPTARGKAIVVIGTTPRKQDNIPTISAAFGLTGTETEVLRLIYKGLGAVETAQAMGIAPSTARTHLRHIFEKTGTSRQSELVYFVANYG